MNIEGVTLNLLLNQNDKEEALLHFNEIKLDYFSPAFKFVLKVIKDFYNDNGFVPNMSELEVYKSRDRKTLSALSSIKLLEPGPIDISVAIEALVNQHAQNVALDLIDDIVSKVSFMDKQELVEHIANMPLILEEKVKDTDKVFSISNIDVFKTDEDAALQRIYSGICDEWDHEAGGYYRQDYVLLGGRVGSGKSIFCSNLVASQHKQGMVSIYFTIEMTAGETMSRILCSLAGVSPLKLKKNQLEPVEEDKLMATMCSLYVKGDEVLEKYRDKELDRVSAQTELQSSYKERDKGRIIIVDDREMTTATVDAKVGIYKSRYGDDLALAVVDYVNQLVDESSSDMYDWKPQAVVSKSLKNTARKNDICIVSPYQMDDNGQVRLSKAILDPADVAQILVVGDKSDNYIDIKTIKARSATDTGNYRVGMDWQTLTIDPKTVIIPQTEGEPVDGLVEI